MYVAILHLPKVAPAPCRHALGAVGGAPAQLVRRTRGPGGEQDDVRLVRIEAAVSAITNAIAQHFTADEFEVAEAGKLQLAILGEKRKGKQ